VRVLVTGAEGFVGKWVVKELVRAGHEVIKGELTSSNSNEDFEVFDVRDLESTRSVVDRARPDAVSHLAGQASPAKSWTHPFETFQINASGTASLMEALRHKPSTRVLVVGSSHEYGLSSSDAPVREDCPLDPKSPYGVSKAAAEMIARAYQTGFGVHTVCSRSFNHTGPGQSPEYAVGSFCSQLVSIERGLQPPKMRVGSLEPVRDFLDVRDVASAYRLLIEEGAAGEVYNVCSGEGTSIGDLLKALLDLAELKSPVEIVESPDGPADGPAVLVGDNSKIKNLGWKAAIPIDRSLADTLDWFRSQGGSGGVAAPQGSDSERQGLRSPRDNQGGSGGVAAPQGSDSERQGLRSPRDNQGGSGG